MVYYARGPRGMQTGLKGSINVESIERIGARNVAGERIGQGSLVTVSPEQLLMWNPEIVITAEAAFAAIAATDDVWKSIKAVRDRHLYVAPEVPFPWLDSPPSVNRLIGLKWLGRVLYPEAFPEDLRAETRSFYSLFYNRAPDERQFNELLRSTGVPGNEASYRPTRQARRSSRQRALFRARGCRSGTAVGDFILRG